MAYIELSEEDVVWAEKETKPKSSAELMDQISFINGTNN